MKMRKFRWTSDRIAYAVFLAAMGVGIASLTACRGETSADSTVIERTVSEAVADAILKLNQASVIRVDASDFESIKKVAIYADEEEVGEMSGAFTAPYESISFLAEDGSEIAAGICSDDSDYEGWAVYDANENFQCGFEEDGTAFIDSGQDAVYNFYDSDKNIIATLQADAFHPSTFTARIESSEGDTLATITQQAFSTEFTIEVAEDSEIDAVTLAITSANYMMQRIYPVSDNTFRQ